MLTLRHYRGDTTTYSFDHSLDMGDITKVTFYARDSIDGTLRVATNSDDHAAAWVIGAETITLTLDDPAGPAQATTTSVAMTTREKNMVYDVEVETAAETVTIERGAFTLIGDVVTPLTDEDLPSAFSTDIVDALEAASAPATANPFLTDSAADALYAALAHTHDDRYYTEAEVTALLAGYLTQAAGDARYGQLGAANTWALAQTFTGQVLASAGTQFLPGLSFSGDPNTGIWNSVADTLVFVTGGGQRVTINGSGFTALIPSIYSVNDAATNATTDVLWLAHNSSGTPAAGFGTRMLYTLESSTSANQHAVAENVTWIDATHASRTSRYAVQTVYNAGSLTDTIAAGRTGAADSTGLWLYDETAASLKQVTRGAADSGGAGFRLLRVAN
jgi:hypothetical protein